MGINTFKRQNSEHKQNNFFSCETPAFNEDSSLHKMKFQSQTQYAVYSGLCASAASLFGKLCGLPTFEGMYLVRIFFFALMLLCNAGVWTLFVKALHASDTTLSATLMSAASNYLFSALTGYLFFNEVTTLLWWSGMVLILIGLLLVARDQQNDQKNE